MKYFVRNSITKTDLTKSDMAFLERLRIPYANVSLKLLSFDVMASTFKGHGIGVETANGGIELMDTETLEVKRFGKPELCLIEPKARKYDTCCVFYSFIDYLAYRSLLHSEPIMFPMASNPTCVIMSSLSGYYRAVAISDLYEKVFLFLPRTESGRVMSKSILLRNPKHVANYDVFYNGHETLFDYCRKRTRGD